MAIACGKSIILCSTAHTAMSAAAAAGRASSSASERRRASRGSWRVTTGPAAAAAGHQETHDDLSVSVVARKPQLVGVTRGDCSGFWFTHLLQISVSLMTWRISRRVCGELEWAAWEWAFQSRSLVTERDPFGSR